MIGVVNVVNNCEWKMFLFSDVASLWRIFSLSHLIFASRREQFQQTRYNVACITPRRLDYNTLLSISKRAIPLVGVMSAYNINV